MKNIYVFILLLFLSNSSFCQKTISLQNPYSIKSSCIVTEVNKQKGIVLAKNNQDGKVITINVKQDMTSKVNKGDLINILYDGIKGDSVHQKVVYTTYDNQTILSTSSVRKKDRN